MIVQYGGEKKIVKNFEVFVKRLQWLSLQVKQKHGSIPLTAVCRAIKINDATLSQWLDGRIKSHPRYPTLERLTAELGWRYWYLIRFLEDGVLPTQEELEAIREPNGKLGYLLNASSLERHIKRGRSELESLPLFILLREKQIAPEVLVLRKLAQEQLAKAESIEALVERVNLLVFGQDITVEGFQYFLEAPEAARELTLEWIWVFGWWFGCEKIVPCIEQQGTMLEFDEDKFHQWLNEQVARELTTARASDFESQCA